jgi:RNA polymerase sigma factor (sigma-70 family)
MNVGHEALAAGPEAGMTEQDKHILELCGIAPDTRYHVPLEETQELIRGVQAKDPAAAQGLIATRLRWIHGTYAQKPEVRSRFDMDEADLLQVGALATIEAARTVDPASPEANTLLHTKTPVFMGSLLARSKLVPSVSEAGHKLVSIRYGHQDDRIAEDVVPVGGSGDVAAAGSQDPSQAAPVPYEATEEAERHEALMECLDTLEDREHRVIALRYAVDDLTGEFPATLSETGAELGISREAVRRIQLGALGKLRQAWEGRGGEQIRSWTPEQLELQRQWFQELRDRQDAGGIAYVRGSLRTRYLPWQVEQYLQQDSFAGKTGAAALKAAVRAAKAEARKRERERQWSEDWGLLRRTAFPG